MSAVLARESWKDSNEKAEGASMQFKRGQSRQPMMCILSWVRAEVGGPVANHDGDEMPFWGHVEV